MWLIGVYKIVYLESRGAIGGRGIAGGERNGRVISVMDDGMGLRGPHGCLGVDTGEAVHCEKGVDEVTATKTGLARRRRRPMHVFAFGSDPNARILPNTSSWPPLSGYPPAVMSVSRYIRQCTTSVLSASEVSLSVRLFIYPSVESRCVI